MTKEVFENGITQLYKLDEKHKDGTYLWLFKCHCGKEFKHKPSRAKNTLKSCGCMMGKKGTHHQTKHPLFAAYKAMLSRCNNPKNKSYPSYGGRGIKVCKSWSDPISGFGSFLADMCERPVGFSIDRLDVNGNYSPENCRWVDIYTQARNKRNTSSVEVFGEKLLVSEIMLDFNVTSYRVKQCAKYAEDLSHFYRLLQTTKGFKKNNTGWVGVIFSSERGKYRLNYKDSQNKSRVKDFKTLEEALLYQKCVLKLDNQKTLKSRSNFSG